MPKENAGVEVDVVGFGGSATVLDVLLGNVRVAGFAGSAGLGVEEGIDKLGKSEGDALAAAGAAAGLSKEKVEAGLGASADFVVEVVSAGLARVGNVIGADVVAGFGAAAASSALTFSLSLAIAAASRSCFSHFE